MIFSVCEDRKQESGMNIRKAVRSDLETVKEISHTTIKSIYPYYYPAGAVAFFLEHHSDKNISDDIENGDVFLCSDISGSTVGTVTVKKNEITRLFVLPDHQGNGFGKKLLEFAEMAISKSYDEIKIDASLPAKAIYLKRGYKETEYHTIITENNDFLCYDVMIKQL